MSKTYVSFGELLDDNDELKQVTVFTTQGVFPQTHVIDIRETIFRINHTNTTHKKIEVVHDTVSPFMDKYKITNKTKKEMKRLAETTLIRKQVLETLVANTMKLQALEDTGANLKDASFEVRSKLNDAINSESFFKDYCTKYIIEIEN